MVRLDSDSMGAPAQLLAKAWEHLRLAEKAPLRHPSWDAILVTAASNAQAALYQQQLEAARYFGRIAKNTLILAVPDPQGKRIGSGGATLSALRVLADQLSAQNPKPFIIRKPSKPSDSCGGGQGSDESSATAVRASESSEPSRGAESPEEHGGAGGSRRHGAVDPRLESSLDVLAGFRVLLIHGGGDSKRVPWANPIGKPFIPLPFLVPKDSDEPVPTLFDHILAVAAPAMGAMEGGGVLIMTGDVLPIFDSKSLFTPDDGACIVTTLASLDVASRHGVLVSDGGPRSPQKEGGGSEEKRPSSKASQSEGQRRSRSSNSGVDAPLPVKVKPLNLTALPPIASIAKPTPIAPPPLFSPPISPHAERSSSPSILSPRNASPPPTQEIASLLASPRTFLAHTKSSRSPPPLPTVPEAPYLTGPWEDSPAERATQPDSPKTGWSPGTSSKPPLYPPPQIVQPLSVSSLLSLQQSKPYYSSESPPPGGDRSTPLQPTKPPPQKEMLPPVDRRGQVTNLLQKPSAQEMEEAGALIVGGAALLDTGIFAVKGKAWRDLLGLTALRPNPVDALLASGEEMSLYEEMAGAWVPARHSWLQSRPLGPLLTDYLGSGRLWYHFAPELEFLHFGTTSEVLDHLSSGWPMANRQLSNVRGDVGPNTVLIGTSVHESASIGEGGFVCDSKLGVGTIVGSRCVLLGVDSVQSNHDRQASSENQASLPRTYVIPSHQCVWVVPLLDGTQVTVCCGVDDNPKALYRESGPSLATFGGVPLSIWLQDRGLAPADLWPSSGIGPEGSARQEGSSSEINESLPGSDLQATSTGSDQRLPVSSVRTDSKQLVMEEKTLWTARLFPVEARGAVLEWIPWFVGSGDLVEISRRWVGAPRLGLAQIHCRIDFSALDRMVRTGRGKLALQMLTQDANGLLRRNVAALSEQVLWGFNTQPPTGENHASPTGVNGTESTFEVASSDWALRLAEKLEESALGHVNIVPKSRSHMARADLLRAGGQLAAADSAEEDAWRAVASETAVGVGITTGHELREDPPGKRGVSGFRRSGIREQGLALREATRDALAHSHQLGVNGHQAARPEIGEVYRVEMPVRLDIAGGWSDTPPWSLERVGRVLNIAANLDGKLPVGVEIVVTDEPGIVIRDDEDRECRVGNAELLEAPLAIDDPFAVGKAALVVTGFGSSNLLGKLGDLVRRVWSLW